MDERSKDDETVAAAAGEDSDAKQREAQEAPGPEQRIAALEAENSALNDRMLRIAADCENRMKRASREQAEAIRREREAALLDMLEVLDSLERALASLDESPDPRSVREGIVITMRAIQQKLERQGVRPVEAAGQRFDPRFHDALAKEPSSDVDPGTVLSEMQKGYMVGDRLLRPASVVVAERPLH
jgi:molecular chaperone GrpE